MTGVVSPTIAAAFAPKAYRVTLFGHRSVRNPEWRWWRWWRPSTVRVELEHHEDRPVRLTHVGGMMRSDAPLEWEFSEPFTVEGMFLYADGQRMAWMHLDVDKDMRAGDRLYIEQVRFGLG